MSWGISYGTLRTGRGPEVGEQAVLMADRQGQASRCSVGGELLTRSRVAPRALGTLGVWGAWGPGGGALLPAAVSQSALQGAWLLLWAGPAEQGRGQPQSPGTGAPW